jgi:hypothetical protein
VEAVAALGDEPVGVGDAVDAARARRAAQREVVLGAAVDVVERRRLVGGDVVELRDRQVVEEAPVGAAVVALVNAAVAADPVEVGVSGSIQITWLSTCLKRSPSACSVLPPSSDTWISTFMT